MKYINQCNLIFVTLQRKSKCWTCLDQHILREFQIFRSLVVVKPTFPRCPNFLAFKMHEMQPR